MLPPRPRARRQRAASSTQEAQMATVRRPGAHSSAGERPLHTREVRGSIPRAPIAESPGGPRFRSGGTKAASGRRALGVEPDERPAAERADRSDREPRAALLRRAGEDTLDRPGRRRSNPDHVLLLAEQDEAHTLPGLEMLAANGDRPRREELQHRLVPRSGSEGGNTEREDGRDERSSHGESMTPAARGEEPTLS